MSWFEKMLVLISQSFNALVLGGNPDETVSARCHREGREGWENFLNRLFFWEPNHCETSHKRDQKFARMILFDEEV